MSDNFDKNDRESRRKRHAKSEKVGFYTACSICLVAVCMAVYSTYNTLSVPDTEATQSTTAAESKIQVNENVTGVTQTMAVPRLDTEISTIAATLPTVEVTTEQSETDSNTESKTALETMLSADVTLVCPLSANNIVREYSEKSVYFKTLNVWKPHTGVDFAGELGDDVYAMTGGAVTSVSEDTMLGKVVEISIDNIVCRYCGLGSVNVAEGDSVDANAKIGTVGAVPCEADDENHIHVEVKVDDEYADPLSFFNNNE